MYNAAMCPHDCKLSWNPSHITKWRKGRGEGVGKEGDEQKPQIQCRDTFPQNINKAHHAIKALWSSQRQNGCFDALFLKLLTTTYIQLTMCCNVSKEPSINKKLF